MTSRAALAFVRRHGVVLESANGPVPSLAGAIVGRKIRGSWWGHPRGKEIFSLTRVVRDAEDVLVCRIVEGKITYVHRRLWPTLIRVARRFPRARLAALREVHTAKGHHVIQLVPFPRWATEAVRRQAARLSEEVARKRLGTWCP